MHRNVRAVVDAAQRRGLAIEPRSFPEGTKTAADAAAAVGVEVGQIVKSLVFLVDGKPTMALVSGDNRLDEAKLAQSAGGAQVERSDADLVRAAAHRARPAHLHRRGSPALRRGVGGRRHLDGRLPGQPVGPGADHRRHGVPAVPLAAMRAGGV